MDSSTLEQFLSHGNFQHSTQKERTAKPPRCTDTLEIRLKVAQQHEYPLYVSKNEEDNRAKVPERRSHKLLVLLK